MSNLAREDEHPDPIVRMFAKDKHIRCRRKVCDQHTGEPEEKAPIKTYLGNRRKPRLPDESAYEWIVERIFLTDPKGNKLPSRLGFRIDPISKDWYRVEELP